MRADLFSDCALPAAADVAVRMPSAQPPDDREDGSSPSSLLPPLRQQPLTSNCFPCSFILFLLFFLCVINKQPDTLTLAFLVHILSMYRMGVKMGEKMKCDPCDNSRKAKKRSYERRDIREEVVEENSPDECNINRITC